VAERKEVGIGLWLQPKYWYSVAQTGQASCSPPKYPECFTRANMLIYSVAQFVGASAAWGVSALFD
jgi:hypothetical protein